MVDTPYNICLSKTEAFHHLSFDIVCKEMFNIYNVIY